MDSVGCVANWHVGPLVDGDEVDGNENEFLDDAVAALDTHGFCVLHGVIDPSLIDRLDAEAETFHAKGDTVASGPLFAETVVNETLHKLSRRLLGNEYAYPSNISAPFRPESERLDHEIDVWDIPTVLEKFTTGARRGLHHDLHGTEINPLSFRGDEDAFKLHSSGRKYGVYRYFVFFSDYSENSGSISFLSKTAEDFYHGRRNYADSASKAEIEKFLVNPKLPKGSILAFNLSTIHSARGLRRRGEDGISLEQALHPIDELEAIRSRNPAVLPYPRHRNYILWDVVSRDLDGELLIKNTACLYALVPAIPLYAQGDKQAGQLLRKLERKIYSLRWIHKSLMSRGIVPRFDLPVLASLIYVGTLKAARRPGDDNPQFAIARDNIELFREHPDVMRPFEALFDYRELARSIADLISDEDVSPQSLVGAIQTLLQKILIDNQSPTTGRMAILYDDPLPTAQMPGGHAA